MKKYKILVTGGSGFLGSHLVDCIDKAGHKAIIFDSIKSNYVKETQKQIVGSILDAKLVQKSVKNCDYVFHFAAIADIEKSKNNPNETIKNNILGTQILLDACVKNKIKRFIFASTIYVYSNLGSFYRLSKQTCESLIEEYSKEFGLKYTILRFGSLYGTRANQFNSIRNIIIQAIEKKQIVRHSNGEEIREYIHVKDAAELSFNMIKKEFSNKHFIITGNQSLKIKELLVLIREIFNNKIKIIYKKNKYDSHYEILPYSYKPQMAKKITPNPSYELGEGILEIIYEIDNRSIKR